MVRTGCLHCTLMCHSCITCTDPVPFLLYVRLVDFEVFVFFHYKVLFREPQSSKATTSTGFLFFFFYKATGKLSAPTEAKCYYLLLLPGKVERNALCRLQAKKKMGIMPKRQLKEEQFLLFRKNDYTPLSCLQG